MKESEQEQLFRINTLYSLNIFKVQIKDTNATLLFFLFSKKIESQFYQAVNNDENMLWAIY